MYRYVIKRLLLMIPVIIGVSFLVFFIMDMAPGDAVDVLAPEGATAEDLEAIRHDLGLDKPVVVRYIDYMAGMLRGDLGVSYISKTDVFQTYVEKLPATIKLSFASILISVILSVPLGIYSATRQGTIQDNISMAFAMIGLAMPHFWLGLLLIIVFSDAVIYRIACDYDWNRLDGDADEDNTVFDAGRIKTGVFENGKSEGNTGESSSYVACIEKCPDPNYYNYRNTACRRIRRKCFDGNGICLAWCWSSDRGFS